MLCNDSDFIPFLNEEYKKFKGKRKTFQRRRSTFIVLIPSDRKCSNICYSSLTIEYFEQSIRFSLQWIDGQWFLAFMFFHLKITEKKKKKIQRRRKSMQREKKVPNFCGCLKSWKTREIINEWAFIDFIYWRRWIT